MGSYGRNETERIATMYVAVDLKPPGRDLLVSE